MPQPPDSSQPHWLMPCPTPVPASELGHRQAGSGWGTGPLKDTLLGPALAVLRVEGFVFRGTQA